MVRSPDGEVRQPFSVVFWARAVGGSPKGDLQETSQAAWVPVADLTDMLLEPATRAWLEYVLDDQHQPHLA